MRLSNRDQSYLLLASRLAEKSALRQRHGAVAVKGGSVVSLGYNKYRNLPQSLDEEDIKQHAGVHAEIDCLRKISPDSMKGITIYVARINRSGEKMFSKPCKYCQDTLDKLGIKKVVYTV